MLAVGNRLNAGSVRGGVSGFALDSCVRFADMKNAQATRSLMSFVLEMMNCPTPLDNIVVWREKIQRAKRVCLDDTENGIQELATDAQECLKAVVDVVQKDGSNLNGPLQNCGQAIQVFAAD